ncbi:Alpha/beta knot methyltransferase, partial [Chytriomyces sp. MP71]
MREVDQVKLESQVIALGREDCPFFIEGHCFVFFSSNTKRTMEFLQPQKAPKIASTPKEKESQKRLIVVLEQASLETVKLGKGKEGHYALLNCDDHHHLLKKHNRDISESRPDITHQCLLTLLDSPLNKAGLLQVYIHTTKNALIEVNPHVRIPRTFKRFCGLMGKPRSPLSL